MHKFAVIDRIACQLQEKYKEEIVSVKLQRVRQTFLLSL